MVVLGVYRQYTTDCMARLLLLVYKRGSLSNTGMISRNECECTRTKSTRREKRCCVASREIVSQMVLTADIKVASINHQRLAAETSDAYIWFYSVLGVILGKL